MSIETVVRRPKGSRFPTTRFRVRIRTTIDGEPHNYDQVFDTEQEAKRDHEAQWAAIKSGEIREKIIDTIKAAREPSVAELLDKHQLETYDKRAVSGREVEKKRLLETIPNVFIFLGRFPEKNMFKGEPLSVETPKGHLFRFGDVRLTKCNEDVISAWLDARGAEISEETLKRELGLISAAFGKAKKHYREYPVENPILKLHKEDKPKSAPHRKRVLSHEEEKILFATLDSSRSRVKDVVRVALGTAMRQSEILHLNWNRVDLQNRTIRLDEDKATRAGSRRDSRTIGLFPVAYDTLLRMWNEQKKPDCGLVFGFTTEGFKASWKRLLQKSGIQGFRFHDLRHTAITRAAASGLSVIQTTAVFGIREAEHLSKIAFEGEDAKKAAEKAAKGETLSANEVAAIGGHSGLRTTQKYANVAAADVVAGDLVKANGPKSSIKVKKSGELFVATLKNEDGEFEAEGASVAEAKALLIELIS